MRIGTAEHDSTFLSQGQALAAVLPRHGVDERFEIMVSPGASIDNANGLESGELDLGFMAANWIGRARRGEPPFKRPIDLRVVAPMNAGPLFFIARADSGLAIFDDLKGKRVSIGPATSGMRQHAQTMLKALGLGADAYEPVHLSFADGAQALTQGEIDAQLQCPIPNKVMTELDGKVALRVIDWAPGQLEALLAKVPFYRRVTMRQGALRALVSDSPQPGVLNVLVCHARSDAGRIGTVAAAILAGARELEAANALFAGLPDLFEPLRSDAAGAQALGGVALHEGALASYRNAGLFA